MDQQGSHVFVEYGNWNFLFLKEYTILRIYEDAINKTYKKTSLRT
jgi:hypothetical protein